MLVLIAPHPGRWRTFLAPLSSARPSLLIPVLPALFAGFVPRAEMKSSRKRARRWVLRELDRRLHLRGPAAMEPK